MATGRKDRLLVLVLVVSTVTGCTGKYVRHTTTEAVEATPERLARGSYVVNHLAACGSCHTTRDSGKLADPERADELLAGGNVLETVEPKMLVWVPNITSESRTGIGTWSDDQVMRAIRDGVDNEGTFLLPVMPFGSFQYMSDDDARDVVAYLRSIPRLPQSRQPIKNEVPYLVQIGLNWFGAAMHQPARNVSAPPRSDPVKYGEYIARLGTCADCHSLGTRGPRDPSDRFLAGSEVPFPEGGQVWAPNLTPDPETGIGRFAPDQVKRAIREGVRLDGKKMAPPMETLVPHYAGITDADLDALVAYLFAQKPVKNSVPARKLDPETRARLGQE